MLEYEHKFIELSRFAPESVATKTEKCSRFMKGLWLDIQGVVIANMHPSMRELAQVGDKVVETFKAGAIAVRSVYRVVGAFRSSSD